MTDRELMTPYTSKSGATQFKPSTEYLAELDQDGDGFCLACGNTQPAEPDARRYRCDACGQEKVYGAGELMLMGLCF